MRKRIATSYPHPGLCATFSRREKGSRMEKYTMSLSELKSAIPDYAKDLRLNLDSVLSEGGAPGLSSKQIGLIALASAMASRHAPLTSALAAESAQSASAQ